MDHRPELLQLLGNETRLRILLALAKRYGQHLNWGVAQEMTVYALIKATGLDRQVVKNGLRLLVESKAVVRTDGPKDTHRNHYLYKLPDSLFTKALLGLFQTLGLLNTNGGVVSVAEATKIIER